MHRKDLVMGKDLFIQRPQPLKITRQLLMLKWIQDVKRSHHSYHLKHTRAKMCTRLKGWVHQIGCVGVNNHCQ